MISKKSMRKSARMMVRGVTENIKTNPADKSKRFMKSVEKIVGTKYFSEYLNCLFLENPEIVIKYIEKKSIYGHLSVGEIILYNKTKKDIYDNCNHLLVLMDHDYDPTEGRSSSHFGCIKCGLNKRVLENWNLETLIRQSAIIYDDDTLTLENYIMYNYLQRYLREHNSEIEGTYLNIQCDFELGKAICRKIIENNPGISDEMLYEYFASALYNIRTKKSTDAVQKSRVRRLSLNDDFHKWEAKDIKRKF